MSAPNLLVLATVYSQTAHLECGTSAADLIAAVPSGKLIVVDAIYATNITDSTTGWVTLTHFDDAVSLTYELAHKLKVPARSTINILLGRPLYMAEGDYLQALANAVTNVSLSAPYSLMAP